MTLVWRCVLIVGALMAGWLLAAGCGGEEGAPPPVILTAGDARQTGALGSACWKTWGCGDVFGVVVPTEPVPVARGEPLIFELGFDPTDVYVAVWRADQGEVVWDTSRDRFVWEPSAPNLLLGEMPALRRTIELRPDLPRGTYIVKVSAHAAGYGSASYGFHIEILP